MSKYIALALMAVTVWQDPAGLFWIGRQLDRAVMMAVEGGTVITTWVVSFV